MKDWIKAKWQWMVDHAKWQWMVDHAKGLWKSWTAWFSAILFVAPDVLPLVQQNFETIKPYIPDALESSTMKFIALVVLLLRLKTTASLAEKGKPK